MIVLDTHIWVWWVHNDPKLPRPYAALIQANESSGIGISVFSCWEVAKLVQLKRLTLHVDVETWLQNALAYPGIVLLPMTPRIAVEANQLPGTFHKDPADEIIVATARDENCALVTVDSRILAYPHVQHAP